MRQLSCSELESEESESWGGDWIWGIWTIVAGAGAWMIAGMQASGGTAWFTCGMVSVKEQGAIQLTEACPNCLWNQQ